MFKKNYSYVLAVCLALCSLFVVKVSGVEVVKNENDELNISGRMQLLGILEYLKDPVRDDYRLYLFQNQSRLRISGRHLLTEYKVEWSLGGEEVPKTNSVLSMLDYYLDVPLMGKDDNTLRLRGGQFKVPYSREKLAEDGSLEFADRSINTLGFNLGRDYGFAVHSRMGKMSGAFGIFAGAGPNIPVRYIAEVLGVPMLAMRVGFNNNLDKNILDVEQINSNNSETKYATYLSAVYMKDSRVGHSSAMSSRLADISLLYNKSWNPYLRAVTASQIEIGELKQVEADFAYQKPLGSKLLSAEIEANYATYSNPIGSLSLTGGVAKVGMYFDPFGVALRYAVLVPDNKFGYYDSVTKNTYSLSDGSAIHEITPSILINVKNRNLKLIFDAPIGINTPVVVETGVTGAYNLMVQPDQASYAKIFVERQTVVTGRMILQFSF